MGFGMLFLGMMFLYDFEIGLRGADSTQVHAVLDIFPDLLGWILILFGLRALAKHTEKAQGIKNVPLFFLIVSVLTLLKGTVLFPFFFQSTGIQSFAGEAVDLSVHLLELAFLYCLFSVTAVFCRKKGEDKLSTSHGMVGRIVLVEGCLFLISKIAGFFSLSGTISQVFLVISKLDYLFWVFLVWYGVIALCRAMIRISD